MPTSLFWSSHVSFSAFLYFRTDIANDGQRILRSSPLCLSELFICRYQLKPVEFLYDVKVWLWIVFLQSLVEVKHDLIVNFVHL